jgi:hypothetical protein
MKHGSGIEDRDDKSSGIEILMVDSFDKINPTDPLRFDKQTAREIDSIPPGSSLGKVQASR